MKRDQKIVAIGAVSGVTFMAVSVYLLSRLIPAPELASTGDRLAYALKWDALAAFPFFVMIVAVGNARFFSDAIDPTLHKDGLRMEIDGRVADNTAQQLLLFLIASLAVAAQLSAARLPIIAAAAVTFCLVRIAFWVGYRINPLYRAFGFAGTAYLNLCLLVAALWLAVG